MRALRIPLNPKPASTPMQESSTGLRAQHAFVSVVLNEVGFRVSGLGFGGSLKPTGFRPSGGGSVFLFRQIPVVPGLL